MIKVTYDSFHFILFHFLVRLSFQFESCINQIGIWQIHLVWCCVVWCGAVWHSVTSVMLFLRIFFHSLFLSSCWRRWIMAQSMPFEWIFVLFHFVWKNIKIQWKIHRQFIKLNHRTGAYGCLNKNGEVLMKPRKWKPILTAAEKVNPFSSLNTK